MTDSTKTSPDIDIHELLAEHRAIAVVWSIQDVQSVREDLSNDQAWEVLLRCKRIHDCNDGFNWHFIEQVADSMFPEQD